MQKANKNTKALLSFSFLFCWIIALCVVGCATAPPTLRPAPSTSSSSASSGTTPASPFRTITFGVSINPAGKISTQFTKSSSGNTYIGIYRIVINTLNTALIGSQTAITTSSDTWTDYFQLDQTGWSRNHRIALPNSQQPQQFTGPQAVTPGTIASSLTSFSLALSLPDVYLGNGTLFNASIITYIAPTSNPLDLHPIDALGPLITTSSPIDFISFNSSVSTINSKSDTGGLGDWASYPLDFPDLGPTDYQNFDVQSMTISVQ